MSHNVFDAVFSVDNSKEKRWKHKDVSYASTYTFYYMHSHMSLELPQESLGAHSHIP